MKRIFWLFLVCLIAVPAVAEELKTDKEKISYAIGMSIGSDMQRQELDLDVKLEPVPFSANALSECDRRIK